MKDVDYLRIVRAIALARKGEGHTRPNPPVGALVVKGSRILGAGYHRRCGLPHAEVEAIRAARRKGRSTAGAVLYVTLEPCSRPGRVGACTDAIIAAGIARVVYAIPDPNPENRNKAKRILARAGIVCECYAATHPLSPAVREARRLIAPFAKHMKTSLPFVTVKIALSLDGRICDDWGNARWISSAHSRRLTGRLRERVDAIMVGGETVRKDDPSLLSHGRRNDDLLRVVISRSGNLPPCAQVFADGRNETLVFRNPKTALRALGRRGALHVLCEGGLGLARSLAEAGLVDEWITVLAPRVIGHRRVSKAVVFKGCDDVIVSTEGRECSRE